MDAADANPITGWSGPPAPAEARAPRPISLEEFVGLLRCALFYATRGYGRRVWVLLGRPGTHAGALRRTVEARRAARRRRA